MPQILALSADATYTEGDNVTLSCSSAGGPDNLYQWQVNSTNIQGETFHELVLQAVNASTGGLYTCVVTNAAGNDSASTYLFIAPYFISQPVNRNTANGSSVTLQCVAEAFPSPDYLWARTDGQPVREELLINASTLVFNPVLFSDEGDYYCNVTSRDEVARTLDATIASMCELGVVGRSQVYIIIHSSVQPLTLTDLFLMNNSWHNAPMAKSLTPC